ncbi:MAG: serine protease [Actinomycetota bacterium]|nr:serine protease [Actinomycetota bacterium]
MARESAFRVRTVSQREDGHGVATAVGPRLLVTARHVVDGADPLDVSTWDGQVLDVDVSRVADAHDLALLRTSRSLRHPVAFARHPPRTGEIVRVAGYPLGGQFTAMKGIVVDQLQGPVLGEPSNVLRVKAVVLPGYSGGPVLNARGELVGVVYALGRDTRYALAIPASSVARWLYSTSP